MPKSKTDHESTIARKNPHFLAASAQRVFSPERAVLSAQGHALGAGDRVTIWFSALPRPLHPDNCHTHSRPFPGSQGMAVG